MFQVISTTCVAVVSGIVIGVCGGGGTSLYITWWLVAGNNLELFDLTHDFKQLQLIATMLTFPSYLYIGVVNLKHVEKTVAMFVAAIGCTITGLSTFVLTMTVNTVPIRRGLGVMSLLSLFIKARFTTDQPDDTGNPVRLANFSDITQIGITFLVAAISEGLVGTGTIFIILLIFFRNYQKKTMNCLTGIFYACASFMRLVVFSGNATFDLEFLPLYILTPSAVVIGAYFGTKMNISQSAFKTYLTCIVWTCGWSALLTNTNYSVHASVFSMGTSVIYLLRKHNRDAAKVHERKVQNEFIDDGEISSLIHNDNTSDNEEDLESGAGKVELTKLAESHSEDSASDDNGAAGKESSDPREETPI